MRQVHLKRGKTGPIRAGHPWVFAGSIERVTGDGDLAEVFGDRGDRLGLGLWSGESAIRVRMLGDLTEFGDIQLRTRLVRAISRRRNLGLDQQSQVFRATNSEGDGLPGLSVDVFGDTLVTFVCSTLPMWQRRASIAQVLHDILDCAVLERPTPPAIARLEGFQSSEHWHTDPINAPFEVVEHGVRFLIDPQAMQKTGHYADMREHRAWIGAIANGKRVLDAYSYTGGFALHAARGGATGVVGVDSSATAVECLRNNARLNGFEIEAHVSDAGDYLRSAFDRGEGFDIVVLDPPKLAPSKKHVGKALKVYQAIAIQAGRLLQPGGLLCIGSCSEAIGIAELERVFGTVTERLGRTSQIVYSGGQPPDHPYPAAMPEGRYLTFLAAEIG